MNSGPEFDVRRGIRRSGNPRVALRSRQIRDYTGFRGTHVSSTGLNQAMTRLLSDAILHDDYKKDSRRVARQLSVSLVRLFDFDPCGLVPQVNQAKPYHAVFRPNPFPSSRRLRRRDEGNGLDG